MDGVAGPEGGGGDAEWGDAANPFPLPPRSSAGGKRQAAEREGDDERSYYCSVATRLTVWVEAGNNI